MYYLYISCHIVHNIIVKMAVLMLIWKLSLKLRVDRRWQQYKFIYLFIFARHSCWMKLTLTHDFSFAVWEYDCTHTKKKKNICTHIKW